MVALLWCSSSLGWVGSRGRVYQSAQLRKLTAYSYTGNACISLVCSSETQIFRSETWCLLSLIRETTTPVEIAPKFRVCVFRVFDIRSVFRSVNASEEVIGRRRRVVRKWAEKTKLHPPVCWNKARISKFTYWCRRIYPHGAWNYRLRC